MKELFWKLLVGFGDWKICLSVLGAITLTAFFTQGSWIASIVSGVWVLLWVYGFVANWISEYIDEKKQPRDDGRIMNFEQALLFILYYPFAFFLLVPLFFGFQIYVTFGDFHFNVEEAMRPYLISMFVCHIVILWMLFPAWDHLVATRKLLPEFQEKKPVPGSNA